MNGELWVVDRQRRWKVDRRRLRRLVNRLMERLQVRDWRLGILWVGEEAMAGMNERWLQHEGSTDIITFDHRNNPEEPLHGELIISLDDAVRQARLFHTSPEEETVRYVIHGVLHLLGEDDHSPEDRRRMRRLETRELRLLQGGDALDGLVQARGRRLAKMRVFPGESARRSPSHD